MDLMNILWIGLVWILAAGCIFGVVCACLMATWMQVNDRRDEQHGTKQTQAQTAYTVHKRRRTAA